MTKEADVQEVMSLLETFDVNDEFLDDIQSDEEASNASRNNTTDDDFEYENLEQMDDETQEDDATFDSQHQLWRDTSEWQRSAFEFTGNFGVKLELQGITDPVGIFKSFIDGDIIELLVTETNKYARKYIDEKYASGKMKRKSRDLLWQDTNEGEVIVMLALVALQGIVNKPNKWLSFNKSIASYTHIWKDYVSW